MKVPGLYLDTALLKARLNLVLGALLFSTGGTAIKTATLTGWQLSCFRSLVAGAAGRLRHGISTGLRGSGYQAASQNNFVPALGGRPA